MSCMPLGSKWARPLLRVLMRMMASTQVPGVRLEVHKGPPAVRIYRPEQQKSDAALLWIHGGGYLIGGAVQDDRTCGEVCRNLGMAVVSVEYRLAPEHPFPAASEDCLAAWEWLQHAAPSLGVDAARVVIGGQSAGGGLAAGLVQRVEDLRKIRGGPGALAQWLFCPMLDDRTAAQRNLDAVDHYVWNNRLNAIGWQAFLGQAPGLAQVSAYAVPARREELEGLPPAWIGAGDIELFFEEDQAYAERLRQAGGQAVLQVVPGAPHGFEAWAAETDMARAYVAEAQSWLREAIEHPSRRCPDVKATLPTC